MNSHTPDEAKTKWCPATRLGVYHGSATCAVNRHPQENVEEDCRCRAEACMWWQWDPHSAEPRMQPRTQEEKIAAMKEAPIPTRGYCGAAAR